MDLSILQHPAVGAFIAHSVDFGKWFAAKATESPIVKKFLPWIAAILAYALNGLIAWIVGGDVETAVAITGPLAGAGAVFYNEVIKKKK